MKNKNSIVSTDNYKGVRDFYPEDMFVLNHILNTCKSVAERFGYIEYGASILESAELYRSKTSEEIVKDQTYTFKDRGDREVTLRPEMTPTLARMIAAKRRTLAFPLRWYSTPNLFRYERPQRGRLREHWQMNADLFGVSTLEAEAEIIALAHTILLELGAKSEDFEIRLNSRVFLRDVLAKLLRQKEKYPEAIRLIDKKEKITAETFESEWKKLSEQPFNLPTEPSDEIRTLIKLLGERDINNVRFYPSLVRGFDYYTGIIFEVFDTNPKNARSLFGGGRYDNLLEVFGEQKVPAVGFGMGDVTVMDFLALRDLIPAYRSSTDVYLIPIEKADLDATEKLSRELREMCVKVAVDLTDKKVGDKIKTANKLSIPFVVFVGKEEAASGKYKFKILNTHEEKLFSVQEIADTVWSHPCEK